MNENVTHNRRYAKFRDFAEAVLGFLRETVPRRFHEFSSTITDNFRVINPKDFRILVDCTPLLRHVELGDRALSSRGWR